MSELPEPRGAFGGFIGPRNLMSLVEHTAPWTMTGAAAPPQERLSALVADPLGWRAVLAAADRLPAEEEPSPETWTDYFALCLAAHFATAMTYVPTDVDTKIRDRLWFMERGADEHERCKDLALSLVGWDVSSVSRRQVMVGDAGPISGHDGERLSVLCGGILGCKRAGDDDGARSLTEAVHDELTREADAFLAVSRTRGAERTLLTLAAVLTHNAGDVNQGLSARKGQRWSSEPGRRFGRLAHERGERYGGAFILAAALYKELMASEGHRNYPLRAVKALRTHADHLLPFSPFLEGWGEHIATTRRLTDPERAEVVAALAAGIRKVPGQQGYQRALAGFDQAFPGGLAAKALRRSLPASTRKALKDPSLRRAVAVRPISFESGMAKRAREIVARVR